MSLPARILGLLFRGALALGILAAPALSDQIVMKNGDRVSGGIVKQDGKTVTIKTANFGLITAPWDQVASVETDTPVSVVLKDGKSLQGKLATRDGKVEVGGVTAAAADVTAIRNAEEQQSWERLQAPALMELWTGRGSLGWAGTNGNAKTLTFTAAATASRTTNTDKTSLYFNMVKASALVDGISAETARAVRGGLAYDRNLSSRLFVNAFNDYEYDRFQDLDLRFVLGGGLGFHAYKSSRAVLDLLGGVDYNRSAFGTGLTRNSAEAFWGNEYTLKLRETVALRQSFRMFDNLSDLGQYRVNFDLGLSTRLNKRLTWDVSLSDRYLSNPIPGRKSNDWLYSTGLGFTFGH